jgi:hypothetical protein
MDWEKKDRDMWECKGPENTFQHTKRGLGLERSI